MRFDRAFVVAATKVVKFEAKFPEHVRHFDAAERLELATRGDAKFFESCGGDFANAPDAFNREWLHKFVDLVDANLELAVGFAPVAGDFGEKFIGRDACGTGKAGFLKNLPTNDVGESGGIALVGGDVEVGFVEGERFYKGCVAVENGANQVGIVPINVESRGHKNEVGAFLQGQKSGHGRVATVFTRFVIAGGKHAALLTGAADSYGVPGEFRPVANLDGGIESVHIEMDDFAFNLRGFHS